MSSLRPNPLWWSRTDATTITSCLIRRVGFNHWMKIQSLFLLALASLAGTPFETFAQAPVTFEVVVTFDYPGSVGTVTGNINDAGDVAGTFNPTDIYSTAGYVRFQNGRFSDPIYDPRDQAQNTFVEGINNSKTLCGSYATDELSFHYHGFILADKDIFTFFDVDGTTDTTIFGINDAGNTSGNSHGATDSPSAWVEIDGTVSIFKIPGSTIDGATGINNLNQVVGDYRTGQSTHSFLRDADGSLRYPIDAAGAESTDLYAINDRGQMVGSATVLTATHAVFFPSPSRNVSYDYPGAVQTYFTGINSRGLISGFYRTEANGLAHGFIVRVKR